MSAQSQAEATIAALDSPLRLKMLRLLGDSDLRVQELADRLGAPLNLVSYHLRILKQAQFVRDRRSLADGRDFYYSLELPALQAQYLGLGSLLHPSLRIDRCCLPKLTLPLRTSFEVLFVCTHNSARSQIAEAILRQRSGGALAVSSAGTHPAAVHPLALQVLNAREIPTGRLRSKHIEEFSGRPFDVVITVCDRAREECPPFSGETRLRHWSLPDPLEVQGSLRQRRRAFEATAEELEARIQAFLVGEQSRLSEQRS